MFFPVRKRNLAIYLLLSLAWLVAMVLLKIVFSDTVWLIALASLLFTAMIVWERKNLRDRDQRLKDDLNMQSVVGIYATLNPRAQLPLLRGSALSADAAHVYLDLIRQHKPETIIELGSGSSTILAGYQVEKNGKGRVIALDHHPLYCDISRDMVKTHGLENVAEVRLAEMKEVEFRGRKMEWYDPSALDNVNSIDLLFIDGPIDVTDQLFRAPAFDLLEARFSDNIVIYVDDCHRPRWRNWVHEYAKAKGYKAYEHVHFDKRNIVLQRG